MNSAAIILAAGFSSRMGSDKALLELGGRTTLERIVNSHQEAGVDQIILVTGQNHAALARLSLKVKLVRNPAPEQGMFSSIQAGVAALDPAVAAFFVHPVDTPLVSPATLTGLICALQQNLLADTVIPVFQGRRGHPPLLSERLSAAIDGYSGGSGLRGFLSNWRLLDVACGDRGCILGMNTPEEYAALKAYAEGCNRTT